jgi:predicted small secreted protein
MKKLVFMFVAVAAISFASCGNKAQQAPVDTDSIAEVVDSVVDSLAVVDTTATDSVK